MVFDHQVTAERFTRCGDIVPDKHFCVGLGEGARRIRHTHRQVIPDFAIMHMVVTNGQFEEFLTATGYQPRFTENFLKHRNGVACPPAIKDGSVVYVSLDDARAFANWAGMELSNEWEWQKAAKELE